MESPSVRRGRSGISTAAPLGSGHGARAGGTTMTLSDDVVHHLGPARPLGPVPASQRVTVGVGTPNGVGDF